MRTRRSRGTLPVPTPALTSTLIGALVAFSTIPAHAPAAGSRCDMIFRWAPSVNSGWLYFLGTATTDSVPAPPGDIGFGVRDGAGELGVRGQVVRVHAVLAPDPAIAAAAPGAGEAAVVVWWSYDSDCDALLWDRSILHADPGEDHVFVATVRDRADWVDGMPTVDVRLPYHTPFPGAVRRSDEARVSLGLPAPEPRPLLSAAQLFDFLSRLPARHPDAYFRSSPSFTAEERDAVLAWARDHPELVDAEPVRGVIRLARTER